MDTFLLAFLGTDDASLYFNVGEKEGTVIGVRPADEEAARLSPPASIEWVGADGEAVGRGYTLSVTAPCVVRAVFRKDPDAEPMGETPPTERRRLFRVETSAGVTPMLLPGDGVVWNHGALFPLLLAKDLPQSVYVPYFAGTDAPYCVPVIKGIPLAEECVTILDGEETLTPEWYPKLHRPWFWHSAELSRAGELRYAVRNAVNDVRFTVRGRTVVCLKKADPKLLTAEVRIAPEDESGRDTDARIEIFDSCGRVALADHLRGEDTALTLPEGTYTLLAHSGIRRRSERTVLRLRAGEKRGLSVRLKDTVRIPAGWYLGELHCHSAYEDATAFPTQTMRAARACGRNFVFQTDKEIGTLLRHGTHGCDVPGEFLGMPGQEIMCHELHMNVLNTDRELPNPQADDLTALNPDVEERVGAWIGAFEEMRKSRPCAIMLNHPTHDRKVMENGCPYFRSWWVADVFKDFTLVENCDYQGWYDRLNRNRRLFAAWTGDGHDVALMYPGQEGVCVWLGEKALTEENLIDALLAGRFFSTREPGCFLELTAGDQMSGGSLAPGETPTARVRWRAATDAEKLELIVDGRVQAVYEPGAEENAREGETEFPIPAGAHWFAARIKLRDTLWPQAKHSFTPFMFSGFDAFTNPIFLR